MTSDTTEFIRRTNLDYSAWCKTYYSEDALNERGMMSLHGLWAWQEQERRIAKAVAAERERWLDIVHNLECQVADYQKRLTP